MHPALWSSAPNATRPKSVRGTDVSTSIVRGLAFAGGEPRARRCRTATSSW
jgi:hypothetical protein